MGLVGVLVLDQRLVVRAFFPPVERFWRDNPITVCEGQRGFGAVRAIALIESLGELEFLHQGAGFRASSFFGGRQCER